MVWQMVWIFPLIWIKQGENDKWYHKRKMTLLKGRLELKKTQRVCKCVKRKSQLYWTWRGQMPRSSYRVEVFCIEPFHLAPGLWHYSDRNEEKVKRKAIKRKNFNLEISNPWWNLICPDPALKLLLIFHKNYTLACKTRLIPLAVMSGRH